MIENARGFFDYYLDRLCVLHDTVSDRRAAGHCARHGRALRKTGNDLLRDTYAQKTAIRLSVVADAVRQEFKKNAHTAAGSAQSDQSDESDVSDASDAPDEPPPSQHEWWLLRVLLEDNDLADWVGPAGIGVAAPCRRARYRPVAAGPGTGPARQPGFRNRRTSAGKAWSRRSCPTTARYRTRRPLCRASPTRDGLVKILRDKHIERLLAALNRVWPRRICRRRSKPKCWPKRSACASSKRSRSRPDHGIPSNWHERPLQKAAETLGLTRYARHIFLCADQTEPKCCAEGSRAEVVGIFEAALEGTESGRAGPVGLSHEGQLPARVRWRADCRRLSRRHLVSLLHPAVLERIIQEHLIQGRPVAQVVLAQNARQ